MKKEQVVKEKWIVIDGSIFTEREETVKPSLGLPHKARTAIAFNVGKEIAERIVNLHNAQLNHDT